MAELRLAVAHVGNLRVLGRVRPFCAAGLCMDLPVRQAFATPGEEDPDWVVGVHHVGPHLEEALHDLHRLDVGHRAQHRAPEALSGRERLTPSRLGLERLRDSELQGDRGEAPGERNARSPGVNPENRSA